jgi:hypothetical protein
VKNSAGSSRFISQTLKVWLIVPLRFDGIENRRSDSTAILTTNDLRPSTAPSSALSIFLWTTELFAELPEFLGEFGILSRFGGDRRFTVGEIELFRIGRIDYVRRRTEDGRRCSSFYRAQERLR